MFVRLKINKSGSTSVQIVQKRGRINKVLRVVGCSSDPAEIAALKERALYEKERMFGATLFDPAEKDGFQKNDHYTFLGRIKRWVAHFSIKTH